jgi:iron complex transport system ATP-binding protein
MTTPVTESEIADPQKRVAGGSSPSGGPASANGDNGADGSSELRLSDVTVRYRTNVAVEGVTLAIGRGQWLTVIGPNGAGKSTLLKAIAGIVDFDGSIELATAAAIGRQPKTGSEQMRRQQVAYVPQSPVLPVGMTTAEYVLLGRTSHLKWYRFESRRDRELVSRTLADLDLEHHASRPVAELSGGEAQRVALARAIVQQASVLVLDEPTSALDLAHQVAVLELVDRLRRRHGLIVITSMHDLTIASRFADRVLLLDRGKPAVHGRPDEVLTSATLTDHYGIDVSVMPGPHGGVIVVPVGQKSADDNDDFDQRETRRS